ncbi:heme-binding protein [Escherichia coli]|uniref:Heme-binding protein n=1 Tax=Escherichia coli TaxID=562 RepID=A0AAP6E9M7_ECOLX|nr:heme-binding protein [Escherichia coli]EED1845371.1 heme-binding protein [Escherichia coli]EEZ1594897.1 heme-binding protein [Escherichia coli]EIT9645228.1 heme-binding protein [Escherichia coli]ELP0840206.1 heme-binding protein [Escherichia coli]MCX8308333.1 heme-binding protein [Escherichia coli]
MSANDNSLDNWINKAIDTQLPERRMSLSLGDSELLAKLAKGMAQSCNVSIVFSLVDACGHQRFFFSMNDARLISHTLAPQKAWTAVALKMPTHELTTLVQPGGDLYGLEKEKDICCLGGGFPCWSGGRLLGGIGISGGSVEEDMLIARQTIAQFSALRYPLATTR